MISRLWKSLRGVLGGRAEQSATAVPMPVRHTHVPDWVPPTASVEDINEIERLVDLYFRRRNMSFQIVNGLAVGHPNTPQSSITYSLLKIVQICLQAPKDEWAGHVASFFDTIERSTRHDVSDPKFSSFDWCESRLRIRMFPAEMPLPETAISRVDIPGLLTVLAVDLGESFCALKTEHTANWPGVSKDWFQTAIANGLRVDETTRTKFDIGNETAVIALSSSDLSGTQALTLSEHPDLFGTFGAIVAIPTANLVLTLSFDDSGVVPLVSRFIQLTKIIFDDGPGSTSSNVYWLREGHWEQIPWRVESDQIIINPPDRLVELLNSLASGKAPQ